MKKISALVFGLAVATASANAAICTLAAASVSATSCSIASAPSEAGASASGTYVVSAPVTIGATFSETAFIGDPTNPFGLGDTTFVLTVNATLGALEHVTLQSMGGYSIDVAYVTGSEVAPATVTEVIPGILSFNFAPTFNAGGSETLVVYTNSPQYQFGGTGGIVDGSGGTGTPFIEAAPEPFSMSLVGGGLAVLGLIRLRRKA